MATPTTGPPAPTSDHQPMALTRSSLGKCRNISAIDAEPVAAPASPSNVRAAMSAPAFHATADRPVAANAATIPMR